MAQLSNLPQVRQIQTEADLTVAFNNGLAKLYQEVFAEPPSCHDREQEEIKQMFYKHYNAGGIVLLSEYNQEIVGFAAIVPLIKSSLYNSQAVNNSGVKVFINENYCIQKIAIAPETTWYLADIGTHKSYRRQGIATRLFEVTRSHLRPDSAILLRVTQAKENAVRLYKSWGFKLLKLNQYPVYRKLNGNLEIESKYIMLFDNAKTN